VTTFKKFELLKWENFVSGNSYLRNIHGNIRRDEYRKEKTVSVVD
jgi:hypothetical protein